MANKGKNATTASAFSIGDALSYGWKTFKKRPKFFVIFSLIIVGVNLIPNILTSKQLHLEESAFMIKIVGTILTWIMSLGTINFALKIYNNKTTSYSSIFEKWRLVFKFFVASILYGLIIVGGFFLLIIPGIIWSIKFQYYSYAMVDRGTGIIDSLKFSSKITKANKRKLFLFDFTISLVSLLGFILLGVGILVTLPITTLAKIYVYKKLSAKI